MSIPIVYCSLDLPLVRIRSNLFRSVDNAWEHEENDANDDQDDSELFPSLVESVDQTLKSGEVPDHLEDPENSQNPDLYTDLTTISREKYRPVESCCQPCWSFACFEVLVDCFEYFQAEATIVLMSSLANWFGFGIERQTSQSLIQYFYRYQ